MKCTTYPQLKMCTDWGEPLSSYYANIMVQSINLCINKEKDTISDIKDVLLFLENKEFKIINNEKGSLIIDKNKRNQIRKAEVK